MPLIDVSLASGRTPEQLRALIGALHEAVARSIGAAPDDTTVIVREVDPALWSRADTTITERRAAAAATTPEEERDA